MAKAPFDPKLAQVLSTQFIRTLTQLMSAAQLSDEQLCRNGTIDIEERRVPVSDCTSEISLLICRPSASTKLSSGILLPCIYFMHLGGMIARDNRAVP